MQNPRVEPEFPGGYRGLAYAHVSDSIDVYALEESAVVGRDCHLSFVDSLPDGQRCQLLLHCTDAIVIPAGDLAELRKNLSPLMKVHKGCLWCGCAQYD